jgi:hypothetical protein
MNEPSVNIMERPKNEMLRTKLLGCEGFIGVLELG